MNEISGKKPRRIMKKKNLNWIVRLNGFFVLFCFKIQSSIPCPPPKHLVFQHITHG